MIMSPCKDLVICIQLSLNDDRVKDWYKELHENKFTGDNKRNYRAVFS